MMPCASIAHGDRLAGLHVRSAQQVQVRAVRADARRREDVEVADLLEASLLGRVEADRQVEVAGLQLGDRLVARSAA